MASHTNSSKDGGNFGTSTKTFYRLIDWVLSAKHLILGGIVAIETDCEKHAICILVEYLA